MDRQAQPKRYDPDTLPVDKQREKVSDFMKPTGLVEKFTFFLIGAGVVMAFLFLTGAANVPQIGRYQIEGISRGDFSDVYVIDTTTGAVKWWDTKYENMPFEQIKVQKGFFK
jgi:hypothetical protein